MSTHVMTIDLGTSVCKVQVFDDRSNELFRHVQEIETAHPRPDWAQQDPATWWGAVRDGIREGARHVEGEIAGIGICSHRESVLGIDKNGEVVIPCVLWADRRCEVEAEELADHFGDDLHQRTGMKADPYFSAPKILWFKRNRPGLIDRVDRFLLPKDYIVYLLTGELCTDPSLASRTMMFDIRSLEWWPEMLEYVGADGGRMPEVRASSEVVGHVTDDRASDLSLDAPVPVVAGAGDRQCEAIGAGVDRETAMESTGSATNLSVATDMLPGELAEGLLYSCHALPGQYLIEQGIGSTGLALRWFRDTFRPPSGDSDFDEEPYAVIDGAAGRSQPGSEGLIFLPFLMGAQASKWEPGARGVIFGLRLGHTYGDIARSILEGIAYEIRSCIEVLGKLGEDPRDIKALGGASRSSLWNQIKADVTGRCYSRPRVSEAAALGAMMLAAEGCDLEIGDVEEMNPTEARWSPAPELREVYDEAYDLYERLYSANSIIFKGRGALE